MWGVAKPQQIFIGDVPQCTFKPAPALKKHKMFKFVVYDYKLKLPKVGSLISVCNRVKGKWLPALLLPVVNRVSEFVWG